MSQLLQVGNRYHKTREKRYLDEHDFVVRKKAVAIKGNRTYIIYIVTIAIIISPILLHYVQIVTNQHTMGSLLKANFITGLEEILRN